MKKRILKPALWITLLFSIMLCAVPVSAEGNAYTVSFPITVSNPDNKIPKHTKFTLVIEGPAHAPLPDPCEIIAEANGSYQFEPITFTEPGNYKYLIRQLVPDDSDLIADDKVYEIDVTVIRGKNGNLEGGMTLSDGTGTGKPNTILFSNNYKYAGANDNNETFSDSVSNKETSKTETPETETPETETPKDEKAPHTGEPLSPAFGGLILSCALFLLYLIVRGHRTNTEVKSDEV